MSFLVVRTIAVLLVAACITCFGINAEAAPVVPSTGAAKPECTYPDPYTVLGHDAAGVEKVEFLSLADSRAEQLRWLFISMDGPPDGAVYVIDCSGRVIAKLPLGYIRETKPGPLVEGHETLQAIYVPGSGTGIQVESVALLQFNGTSINKLWDHYSHNVATESHAMFDGPPNDTRLMTETDHYDWRYSQSGREIVVSGKRTDELEGRIKRKPLLREKFCYRAAKHQFQRCR